ncbi:hypothetical protein [Xanthomonas phage BUDD]|nr:hypothetical protein [Xanthomonas phage BUDD]
MVEVDPDMAEFTEHEKILDVFRQTVASIEHIFPMVQAVEEVLDWSITPALFYHKWKRAAAHMGVDDDIGEEDISPDVRGFLGKFGREEDDDEEDEGEES